MSSARAISGELRILVAVESHWRVYGRGPTTRQVQLFLDRLGGASCSAWSRVPRMKKADLLRSSRATGLELGLEGVCLLFGERDIPAKVSRVSHAATLNAVAV
jgi:hypothetical protein